VETPVLPSYRMPKASIRERRASAIVRFDATGWKAPSNRTGRPSSFPKGTMSSISKSMTSPTRTVCSSPSSRNSIAARSTPRTSPSSGTSAANGPPSSPPKTLTSLSNCSSDAWSSTNSPSRQLPSVITFGVSMMATTRRPWTSVPSI
jgi:hypothetical protein